MDNETIALLNESSSDEDLEELFAIKALVGNPELLANIMSFEKFCLAVNGVIPNFEAFDPPNVLMIAYAVKKAEEVLGKKLLFIEPHEHTTIVYIAHIAWDEGWIILPKILGFAQHELNKIVTPYGKELFKGIDNEYLEKTEPWDDENPISNHCAKTQTVNQYLRIMESK